MSDLRAVLSGDSVIKAVLSSDNVIKAQINSGLTIAPVVDGGDYIHFDVTVNGNNQTFTNAQLADYSDVTKINLMKNGVYIEPINYTKPTNTSIQVNIPLNVGDTIDILATGSAIQNAPAAGSNSQVQFNDDGIFGANVNFTFNKNTSTLNVTNISANGALLTNISGANVNGFVPNANVANTALSVTGANISGQVANALVSGTVYTNAQPNITSVGTLSNVTISGNVSTSNLSVTGTSNVANVTVNGILTIETGLEKVTIDGTGATGNIDLDVLTQSILYKNANASGNFNLNIRGNGTVSLNSMMSVGQSVTCTMVNTKGATPYVLTTLYIDGVTQTVRWLNATAPVVNAYLNDIYSFNIIKTSAGQYMIFGSFGSYN